MISHFHYRQGFGGGGGGGEFWIVAANLFFSHYPTAKETLDQQAKITRQTVVPNEITIF